ncbi:MAG: PEGA domain-containing protein [Fibrobacteria bacterium]|nr:PEGA domain-containing protein [Fibrobacteria bacterium]
MTPFSLSRFVLLVLVALVASSHGMRIAVPDFTDASNDASLAFLSQTLPGALSEPLSRKDGFEIVERSRLNALIAERELDLSGMTRPDSTRALLSADALILGQFGGKLEALTLQVKAIDAASGKVRGVFQRKGTLQEILNGMSLLADQIAGAFRSNSSGFLTIRSSPSGALVSLDGKPLGRTPLVEQAIPAGRHVVLLELEKASPWTEAVTVPADSHVVRVVEMEDDLDASGFWIQGGGSMSGFTRDIEDPLGPNFTGSTAFLLRGRWAGVEVGWEFPTTRAYTVEYPVPYSKVVDRRTLKFGVLRAMVVGDLLHKGKLVPQVGAGIAFAQTDISPKNLDDPDHDDTEGLLGLNINAGVAYRLMRRVEIAARGDLVHFLRDITVVDFTSRDLFRGYNEERAFKLQTWSLQLQARVLL